MADYYGQLDFPQTQGIDGTAPISEIGSFLVAKCNLMKKLGHDVSPDTLNQLFIDNGEYIKRHRDARDDLYWDSITRFDETIVLTRMDTGWPSSNNTIVKFKCQSIQQPHIEVDGIPIPNMIDHFCVIEDAEKRLIIDSLDGEVKQAGPYGTPVAYAVYARQEPRTEAEQKAEPQTRYYTVLRGGESAWDIARKLNMPASELIEHNDIVNTHHIEAGTRLRLPYKVILEKKREVKYKILPKPRKMHVAKEGGAKKWTFGNIKTLDDIKSTGFIPEKTNVTIVAVAYVPVRDDSNQDTELAYYMDANALGDFAQTSQVRYTMGYIWSDLADGHVERPIPNVTAVSRVTETTLAEAKAQASEPDPEPVPEEDFRTTWQTLDPPILMTAQLPDGMESLRITEHSGRREDKFMSRIWEGQIAGTFSKDGTVYGRPIKSTENGYWYGIPMDYLIPNDELYNTEVDAPTRAQAHGQLTFYEKYFSVPLFWAVHHPTIKKLFKTNKG